MKIISSIILVLLLGAGYIGYTLPKTPVMKQDFIVNKKETVGNIPEKLSIPVNMTLFKVYNRIFLNGFVLKAGTYSIKKDTTLEKLFFETLKNPTSNDVTIQLLPGWNIWDMDAYLTGSGILQAGEFTAAAQNIPDGLKKNFPFTAKLTTLEGFLVPDTYRIAPESTAGDIVKLLVQTFDERVYKQFDFETDGELYEALVFASIVEKEEKSSVNKPIVAGILKKRYAEKWFIGADATVCYAYNLTMTDCTPAFIGDHIYEKTAYNTRNSLKLPPTPISNPSIETIRATMQSEPSKYYYYLHDNDGVIHYGKTLEEHNRNKIQYLGR